MDIQNTSSTQVKKCGKCGDTEDLVCYKTNKSGKKYYYCGAHQARRMRKYRHPERFSA